MIMCWLATANYCLVTLIKQIMFGHHKRSREKRTPNPKKAKTPIKCLPTFWFPKQKISPTIIFVRPISIS